MDFLKQNRLLLHLLIGLVLIIIYPMQGLFSGNQNVYYLWAMAKLLPSAFSADPLLNSPDPYPLFSWMVSILPNRFLGFWTTTLYWLLNATYSFSLFGIANEVARLYRYQGRLLSFTSLFLLLHSTPIWGPYLNLIVGEDLRLVWDSGIAEQGVLRGYLQPSVFGVFLLLSCYAASRGKFASAILAIIPAAIIHANYLLLGGVLAVLYLIQARFSWKSLGASAITFTAALPYLIYLCKHFLFLNEETHASISVAVMSGFESNLHINPSNWVNTKLLVQAIVVTFGILIIPKTRFRNTLLGMLGVALILTLIAYTANSTTLISLNPWRLSVVLIPVFATILLARIATYGSWSMFRPAIIIAATTIAVSTIYYRLFGVGTAEFIYQWKWFQLVIFFLAVLVYRFCSRKLPILNSFLEPVLLLVLFMLGSTEMYIEYVTKKNLPQFQAINNLKGPEPNTVYIIPSDWNSFRLNAQKAVFVDENLVYGPALPGITERLNHLEEKNYSEILTSIPVDHTVKLIAPISTGNLGVIKKDVTANHSCYILRQ